MIPIRIKTPSTQRTDTNWIETITQYSIHVMLLLDIILLYYQMIHDLEIYRNFKKIYTFTKILMCYDRTHAYTVHNTANSSYKIDSQTAIILMDNDKQSRISVLIMWFNVVVNQNGFKRDITQFKYITNVSIVQAYYSSIIIIIIIVTNGVHANLKSKLLVCCFNAC